jgi:hypothetical protein
MERRRKCTFLIRWPRYGHGFRPAVSASWSVLTLYSTKICTSEGNDVSRSNGQKSGSVSCSPGASMPHWLSIGRRAVPRIAAQAAYDNRKRQLRLYLTAETKTPVKNPPTAWFPNHLFLPSTTCRKFFALVHRIPIPDSRVRTTTTIPHRSRFLVWETEAMWGTNGLTRDSGLKRELYASFETAGMCFFCQGTGLYPAHRSKKIADRQNVAALIPPLSSRRRPDQNMRRHSVDTTSWKTPVRFEKARKGIWSAMRHGTVAW